MGHAILERVRLFGTQSADYITASGHSGRIAIEASLQAKTGRIHGCTRTLRRKSDLLLHRGHRPYMALSGRAAIAVESPLLEQKRTRIGLIFPICTKLPTGAAQARPPRGNKASTDVTVP